MNNTAKVGMIMGIGIAGLMALILGNTLGSHDSPAVDPSMYTTQEDYNQTNTNKHTSTPEVIGNLPEGILNYEPTQFVGNQKIRHQYYSLSYSTHHKNPEWVAYELRGSRLSTKDAVERENFVSDPQTDAEVSTSDFINSGYDRGHLVPAFDMNFNKTAMREACYLTNVSPQVPEFNRGIWKKLETQVRSWAKANKRLYVVTGPILRHNAKDAPRLKDQKDNPTIPRGFYKVVLDYDAPDKKGIGFLFKNKDIDQPLENFVVSIDRVEAYTNLDFFPTLTDEEQQALEAVVNPVAWGF